jgi:hypothetical protein
MEKDTIELVVFELAPLILLPSGGLQRKELTQAFRPITLPKKFH